MGLLQNLVLRLQADSADYSKGLKKAGTQTKSFGTTAQKSIGMATKAFGVLGIAVSGVAFVGFIKSSLDAMDNLGKMADRMGVTTKALAGLRHAADLGGVAITEMDNALKFMLKNISDAAMGTGEAKIALEMLRLEAEKLKAMNPDEAFALILDEIKKLPNAADKANAAMKIFGRSGSQILTLTADGIKDARIEAEKFGLAIDRDMAKKAEDANDAMTRLEASAKGAGYEIASSLAPAIKSLSDTILNNEFQEGIKGLSTAIGTIASASADGVEWISKLNSEFKLIEITASQMPGVREIGAILKIMDLMDKPEKRGGVTFPAPVRPEIPPSSAVGGGKATDEKILGSIGGSNFYGPGFWESKAQAEADAHSASLEAQIVFNLELVEEEIRQGESLVDLNLIKNEEMLSADERYYDAKDAARQMDIDAEERASSFMLNSRASAVSGAIGLLHMLGKESKSAAIVAIAVEKGLGIAQTFINTKVASLRAMAELGPIAGPPVAAAIEAWGAVNMGLIAATGFAQAAGGSAPAGGAGGGTYTSPMTTEGLDDASSIEPTESRTITINIMGNVVDQDKFARELIPSITKAINDGKTLEYA